MRKSGQKDGRDMVTGVQRESLCGCDMVTGATDCRDMVTGVTEQTRNGQKDGRDMVTGAHDEVTYCSPSISSGK